ncbi:MAG: hypothetical protein HOV79_15730 [Hamadaea sp.]|nr:hypothetical protein [Hamadaea sp.]
MTGSMEFDDRRDEAEAAAGTPDASPWASPSTDPFDVASAHGTVDHVPTQTVQSVVTVAPPAALRAERSPGCAMPDADRLPRHAAGESADEAWPTREMMAGVRGHRPVAARPAPKHDQPVRLGSTLGLVGLVVFALLAAFFAWVAAEPLWLAVGHGDTGKATAVQCVGSGVSQRCVGDFVSDAGVVVERVALLGVDQTDLARGGPGVELTARMAGSGSDQAYVGAALRGLHLRWAVGVALALLCGLGIALSTGAIRFGDRKARRAAIATSLAAPVLLLVGFLAASY